MKNTISKDDFTFQYAGNGYYLVQYTSPKTGKTWVNKTYDKTLMADTYYCNNPKIKHLNELKKFCKQGIINSFIL